MKKTVHPWGEYTVDRCRFAGSSKEMLLIVVTNRGSRLGLGCGLVAAIF